MDLDLLQSKNKGYSSVILDLPTYRLSLINEQRYVSQVGLNNF